MLTCFLSPSNPNIRLTSMTEPPASTTLRPAMYLTVLCSHCRRWSLQARCVSYVGPISTALARALIANTTRTGFPDPFAVATVNGEQTKTTTVAKRTLNPYWNESFDLYDTLLPSPYASIFERPYKDAVITLSYPPKHIVQELTL